MLKITIILKENTYFEHFSAGRVKEGVFLEEFAPLASHSAVCAVLCCAVLCCAVLCCSVLCCAMCCAILEELLRRPKVTIIVLEDF